MKSSLHGLGCFAAVRFPKASAIAEYTGERISHVQASKRLIEQNGKYISQLDVDHYIDGKIGGNDTRYINHSCEPNADVFVTDGSLIVFALREISVGEEVTVDYLNSFDQDQTLCRCRTASCRNK